MTPMRPARTVLAGALLLIVTSGCAAGFGEPTSPIEDVLATRDTSRDLMQTLSTVIDTTAATPYAGSGRWTGCTDDGFKQQYTISARFDTIGPSEPALPDVIDALIADGTLTMGTPTERSTHTEVHGQTDDEQYQVAVFAYTEESYMLLDIYGPCLPVAEEGQEVLDEAKQHTDDIDIGGTQPSSTPTDQ